MASSLARTACLTLRPPPARSVSTRARSRSTSRASAIPSARSTRSRRARRIGARRPTARCSTSSSGGSRLPPPVLQALGELPRDDSDADNSDEERGEKDVDKRDPGDVPADRRVLAGGERDQNRQHRQDKRRPPPTDQDAATQVAREGQPGVDPLPGPAVHPVRVFNAIDGHPEKRRDKHEGRDVYLARGPDERQTTLDSAKRHPERSRDGKNEHDLHAVRVPTRG